MEPKMVHSITPTGDETKTRLLIAMGEDGYLTLWVDDGSWEVIEDPADGLHVIVRDSGGAAVATHEHVQLRHPEAKTHEAAAEAAFEAARMGPKRKTQQLGRRAI